MRKKLIAVGVAALGAVLIGAGGTHAAFSDTESGPPVLVRAGTLDLALSTAAGTETAPVTFTDVVPGPVPANGHTSSPHHYFVRLTNEGTLPGHARWSTTAVSEFENDCNAPEIDAEDTSCGPENGAGELGDQLRVSFSLFPGATCAGNPGVVPPEMYPPTQSSTFREIKAGGAGPALVLAPGATRCVRVDVHFPSGPLNNLAQSDRSSFRLAFRLDQIV